MGGLLSSEFGSRSILQRCQDAAPLRHTAAALGELYIEYVASKDDFTPGYAAMQVYGRAVKALRNYIGTNSSPSRELVLICSAIFFCCELIRGERVAANAHAENGLQSLRQWQDSDGARPGIIANVADEMLMTFASVDLKPLSLIIVACQFFASQCQNANPPIQPRWPSFTPKNSCWFILPSSSSYRTSPTRILQSTRSLALTLASVWHSYGNLRSERRPQTNSSNSLPLTVPSDFSSGGPSQHADAKAA